MKNKKAQLTIFIIIAIFIIAVVVLFFTLKGTLQKEKPISPETAEIQNFVQTCLDEISESAIFDIAERVRNIVGEDVTIVIAKTDDNRSYHISSEKIREELGFQAYHTIEEAVQDLVTSFQQKKISSATDDDRYYNIRMIKKLELQ